MYIGHTRFSLFSPSSQGWKASNGSRFTSAEAYRDYLFSDERMKPRMDIFLGLSLPQLELASQGHEVQHIVSYPSTLPGKYKAQLREAERAFGVLVLDERAPGQTPVSPRRLAADRFQASGGTFGIYRLDDDDLLPADYFDQIALYLRPENAGMMVSLGSGATALYSDGKFYNLRRCHVPMIAIGLLSICRYHNETLIEPVHAPHNQSDRANPVILDSRRPGFLWTRHPAQDSSLGFGTPDKEGLTDLLLGFMDKHPAATPDDGIEAAFPAAAEAFTGRQRPGTGKVQEITPNPVVTDEPESISITPVAGSFNLTVDVESKKGIGKNHMLIAFSIEDASGRGLDPATERDWLAETGLMVSKNPAIGYFCYIPVRLGAHRVQKQLRLPEGKVVAALSVRRFASKTVDIRLQRLMIEQHS